jgi:hypothetical protein
LFDADHHRLEHRPRERPERTRLDEAHLEPLAARSERQREKRETHLNEPLDELERSAHRPAVQRRVTQHPVRGRDEPFAHQQAKRRLVRHLGRAQHERFERLERQRERRLVQRGPRERLLPEPSRDHVRARQPLDLLGELAGVQRRERKAREIQGAEGVFVSPGAPIVKK